MSDDDSRYDMRRASRVSRLVEIEDVRVRMSFFHQPDDEATLDEFHTELLAEVRSVGDGMLIIEAGYRLARHEPESDERELVVGEEVSDEPEILCMTHFLVTYSYTEEPDSEDLEAFAHHNAIFNTWPYWRERVQASAASMGLPPLVVPVHRFSLPSPETNSDESE